MLTKVKSTAICMAIDFYHQIKSLTYSLYSLKEFIGTAVKIYENRYNHGKKLKKKKEIFGIYLYVIYGFFK